MKDVSTLRKEATKEGPAMQYDDPALGFPKIYSKKHKKKK